MTRIMPGAEPFSYPGNDVGCLLIHGFTGSPQEMRGLGQFLNGLGWTVRGALISGHGTHERELARTDWRDWFRSVYTEHEALAVACKHTFVIGQSLGGALSLHLAAHIPLRGVVSLSSPLVTDLKLLWLARVLKYVQPYRKKGQSNIHDPEALAERVAYHYTPNRSNEQVLLFLRHLLDDLPEVRCPALLMHARQDRTVDPQTMPRILHQLGSSEKEMVWLENSGHVVTEDYDRQVVYTKVRDFVSGHIT